LPHPCSIHYLDYATAYIHRKEKYVNIDIITSGTIVQNNTVNSSINPLYNKLLG